MPWARTISCSATMELTLRSTARRTASSMESFSCANAGAAKRSSPAATRRRMRDTSSRTRLRRQPLILQRLRCKATGMAARPQPALADEIARGIVRVKKRLIAEADRRLAERGEGVLQFQVLSALRRSGPCAQNELAESIGQHPTGISRLLEELEQAGLVRRARNRLDRRKLVVAPTARGRSFLAR